MGVLYTIGHSNHAIDAFTGLLTGAGADLVVDVRSVPHSRRFPQFAKKALTNTLAEAGIAEADSFVLTDVEEATGIPVAKELHPDVFAVTYAERSLPEFVAGVADLAIDPALMDAATVAEELVDGAADRAA